MEKIFTEKEQNALNEVVEKLSNVDKSSGDLFDIVATLASDIADIYKAFDAEDSDKIETEKRDAINTAIALVSKLNNF